MLRRKPTRIELRPEDKQEFFENRRSSALAPRQRQIQSNTTLKSALTAEMLDDLRAAKNSGDVQK